MVTSVDAGVLGRRAALAELATDYVLAHGLIELSLRPLAHELGTSDRMLIYHFGSKDALVADVLRIANERAVALVRALPVSPGPRQAVIDLWNVVGGSDEALPMARVYAEAAVMGTLRVEPTRSTIREANRLWTAAVGDHLARSGYPQEVVIRAVTLVDAAFFGMILDLPLDRDAGFRAREVADLADAVALLAHPIAMNGLRNWAADR